MGSIFGVVIACLALAFAWSVRPQESSYSTKERSSKDGAGAHFTHQDEKVGWHWATDDPAAAFTLGLFVVAIFQAGLFAVQLAMMRTGIEDAATTAKAAVTAAEAGKAQSITARTALENAQRPYIFVHGIVQLKSTYDLETGYHPFVDYIVANYGQTPAIIVEAKAGFLIDTRKDPEDPEFVTEDNPLFTEPIISPRERVGPIKGLSTSTSSNEDNINDPPFDRFQFDTPWDRDQIVWINPRLKPNENLFFRVVILYRGPFTDGHETSACWRYDKTQGFFINAGKDTNYEK